MGAIVKLAINAACVASIPLTGGASTPVATAIMGGVNGPAGSRKALSEKDRWTIFTMTVNEDGNMQAEFDYGDHSEDLISYEREWKKKLPVCGK